MVEVLADASLYEYTGGEAPSLEQLQRRYVAQVVGHSENHLQGWLNWIVRPINGGALMGFVQATLERKASELLANIAWVISPIHQGHGVASEATKAMALWLQFKGVNCLQAYVHPEHQASMGVARKQSLHPTNLTDGIEILWESWQASNDRSAFRFRSWLNGPVPFGVVSVDARPTKGARTWYSLGWQV